MPAVAALVLSFTDFDIYALANLNNLRFIGLDNYQRLLTNPLFWQAMGNTLWFVVFGVPLVVVASLAAAMLVNAKTLQLAAVWRVALFAPFVTTLVATAVVWSYLLHTRYGLINYALGGLGIAPVDWLGNPHDRAPRDPDVRGVEDLRLQHDHLPRRAADGAARPRSTRRGSTAPGRGCASATSPCRRSRRPCCWSRS